MAIPHSNTFEIENSASVVALRLPHLLASLCISLFSDDVGVHALHLLPPLPDFNARSMLRNHDL